MNRKGLVLGATICSLTGLLIFGFNNCGKVAFKISPEGLKEQHVAFLSTSALLINNGATYTKDKGVQLTLASPRATDMKISNEADCSDGTWETYSAAKAWTLSKENAPASVYAQYKNLSGDITTCISASIIHDSVPPVAAFSNTPGFLTNQTSVQVNWSSTDNLSGVDSTTCTDANGASSPCSNLIVSTPSVEGTAVVRVVVADKAGNVSAPYLYSYVFDKTPPVVKINSQPATLTGSVTASLAFSAMDAVSGVDKFQCSLDQGAFADCASPMNYAGLTAAAHNFRVQAKDKVGNTSAPIAANWTIDTTAPTLAFTQTPTPYSNSATGTFAFTGKKNNQPISVFECRLDTSAFASCTSPVNLQNLAEGNHSFEVRGTDSLGNVSQPIKYSWLVDLTLPVITFVKVPAPLINTTTAIFQYTASDTPSGVKTLECRLDALAFAACNGATNLTALAEGSHTFQVRAADNAGNATTAAKTFTVDLTLPVVQILTGPAPFVKNPVADFTFNATDNSGIAAYECKIDNAPYAACSSPFASSAVDEGGHVFYVRATDKAGNVSLPANAAWNLDLSPPIIQIISSPTTLKATDKAVIQYKVTDLASGVDKVLCGLTMPSGTLATCQAAGTVDLGALPAGSYGFTISATDKVGNLFKTVVSFQVTAVPIVCDPFTVGGDAICNGGLIGNIYYLDSNGQTIFKGAATKTVDYFIASGIKVNVLLNLKQLAVSTRAFTAGFPTNGGSLVKDNAGNDLTSYFAFDLKTVYKLDPTTDLPGWYQFATLSDDGSNVLITPQGGVSQSLVANDGDHPTRMGCSTQAIYIDDTSRMAMQIKYYQGPPTEIALMMLWKRVNGPTDPLDSACGVTSSSEFFGPAPYTDLTTKTYGQLLNRGWQVAKPSNFIAPPTTP